MRIFFVFSFLALALTSCSLPVRYKCSAFSGVALDNYTGKPIEGARVQVSWTALRSRGSLNFVDARVDAVTLNAASTETDKNGIYTIPAWKTVAPGRLFDIGPHISISDPKTKPNTELESELEYIDRSYENALSSSSHGFAFWTIRLKSPSWALSKEEVSEREKGKENAPR